MKRTDAASSFDPVYQAADLLKDAWSWMILREAILSGVSRFGEFQVRLGVAPKVLSERLARLSAAGLFERRQREGRGAPVDYELTPMGEDFVSCLCAAWKWGARWQGGEPVTRILHAPSGHVFTPEFRCSECAELVRARDVEVVRMHRQSADLVDRSRRRMPDVDLMDRNGGSPIAYTLRVIGDQWSSLLIREAFLGARRFGDFQKNLGIATNILSSRLARLVDLGVLQTSAPTGSPTRGEYRLTEKGHDLYWVPLSLLTWAERWLAPGGPSTELRHKLCGRSFHAVFGCGTCGQPAALRDLVFDEKQAPLASPVPTA